MSKSRYDRLKETAKKGEIPTTQGNRKVNVTGGKPTHPPNKFKQQTHEAAEGFKSRRGYRDSE